MSLQHDASIRALEPLFLQLEQHDTLSDEERLVLSETITIQREFSKNEDLVCEGSRPPYSTLLLSGLAARYKLVENGARQFTAFHVAGDFVDLHAFLLKKMDHGIVALSPCKVAFSDHQKLKRITETNPHLTRMLWLDTLVDGAIHREWIVSMGRRTKIAHLAYLFCELFVRMKAVGLTTDYTFPFPLTQHDVADVLGLSTVHLNRTVQKLRKQGAVEWTNQKVAILEWDALVQVADFDPTYLSLFKEPR
jgi:CRP-like cAMP-binding protein